MSRHPGLLLTLSVALVLTACEAGPARPADDGFVGDDDGWVGGPGEGEGEGEGESEGGEGEGEGEALDGAALYGLHCASCHGVRGEGLAAPRLDRWSRDRATLVDIIDVRMPSDDPARCEGACAVAVADFILGSLQRAEGEDVCAGVDIDNPELLPPRTLRLLTRDEYRATVTDLLRLDGADGASCSSDVVCALDETCQQGRCAEAPCGTAGFAYDPPGTGPGATRVHVAGSFNGWPAAHANGLPLTFDASAGRWVGRGVVGEGRHEYKFVVDERDWIADPGNTQTAPDGFGGVNSVVNVSCNAGSTGGGDVVDFAAQLPPDAKPASFSFQSHAASGLVTPVHVEAYLAAAEAALAAADVPALIAPLGCSSGAACARTVVGTFGRRAFRRPLTSVELDRYAAVVSGEAVFIDGVTLALAAMLSSPAFLYRSELGVADGDGSFTLTAFETASLLAFTLTGRAPDDILLDAAAAGELDDTDGVVLQATRLLNGRAAEETMQRFARQWLKADKVLTVDKHPGLFPGFDAAVRRDLADETGRFFTHVMFAGSGRYDELITSRQGFVSSRTASLYGVNQAASDLTLTTLPEDRRGLLSQASVLSSTSHSDQTSPILRGLFVRERLLCQPLPPPPGDVGGVPEVDPQATTRERFAQHTADPACFACHRVIDDLGFGFEHFDAVGRVRSTENGQPIDHRGDMNDVDGIGTFTHAPFSSMAELANVLSQSEQPERCFVLQAGRYALGHELHHDQACLFDGAADAFIENDGDLMEGVLAVVAADAFRRRAP